MLHNSWSLIPLVWAHTRTRMLVHVRLVRVPGDNWALPWFWFGVNKWANICLRFVSGKTTPRDCGVDFLHVGVLSKPETLLGSSIIPALPTRERERATGSDIGIWRHNECLCLHEVVVQIVYKSFLASRLMFMRLETHVRKMDQRWIPIKTLMAEANLSFFTTHFNFDYLKGHSY